MGKSKSPLTDFKIQHAEKTKKYEKIKLRKRLKRLFSDYRQDNFR